jgi:alkylation response protein AidB-like acyl-CoA dehydrogenase
MTTVLDTTPAAGLLPAPSPRAISGAERAEELEQYLGDPADPANPYGYAAAVARDERDEYPDEFGGALREAGFHVNYLPGEWGGTFESFQHSMTVIRAAARRDLNVMPSTMFSITAATCLRLHGSPKQQDWAARLLRAGGAIGFALSEAEHGSDLLANTARLVPDGGGWRLTGEKWMVGLGRRCEALYLVARTGERGPAAFTAVLINLDGVDARAVRGPAVPTSGMRGIDFAHLCFDGLPVPAAAVVGRPGQALEAAVKAQQVVRVMSMAGSLGCADTALRLTLDFAASRAIGRTALAEAPYPRRELALASAALIAADVAAAAAARGIHAVPEVFSVWGCAAKHVVAEAVSDLMGRCAGVLSTRAVLRAEGPGAGLFQKLQRDAALVRVVDTSALANLRSYTGQLPALAEAAGPGAGREPGLDQILRQVFRLDEPAVPFLPDRLALTARGRDPVTAGLAAAAADVAQLLAESGADETADLVCRLADAVAALPQEAAEATGGPRGAQRGNELVDLAERFAWLHAAACCVHLWRENRHLGLFGADPGSPAWLGAALAYLLARADGLDPRRAAGPALPGLDLVAGLHRTGRLFTAVPVRLAGGAVDDADTGDGARDTATAAAPPALDRSGETPCPRKI